MRLCSWSMEMNQFAPDSPAWLRRRSRIAVFGVLTVFLCCSSTAPSGCNTSNEGSIGPSAGEVIGAAVGIGAAIAIVTVVAVEHSRHTITGCAFSGPNGLLFKTSDSKVYAIEGDANGIKSGEKVKVRGSRANRKRDSNGNQVLVVEQVRKDYGPCPANIAQSSSGLPPTIVSRER